MPRPCGKCGKCYICQVCDKDEKYRLAFDEGIFPPKQKTQGKSIKMIGRLRPNEMQKHILLPREIRPERCKWHGEDVIDRVIGNRKVPKTRDCREG